MGTERFQTPIGQMSRLICQSLQVLFLFFWDGKVYNKLEIISEERICSLILRKN